MSVVEEIAWGDGSGDKIYLTAGAFGGNQTVLVSSDANAGAARTKTVTFSASGVTPVVITVSQEASITTIPYIRGGDGSYIDTGITPDQTTKIIIWARNWNIYTANTCLFGSDSGNTTTNAFLVFTRIGAATGGISTSWGSNSAVNANDQWKHLSHYHKYEYGADGFYVDDVLVSSVTATTFSNPYSIYLFCDNRNGGKSIVATQKDICACKIYKNNVLVRDFTAVNSPSVGLYDAVSDTLFTNAGTGSFTYGAFNPNAYTPLEYVSCDKQQYFDSGIYGTGSLTIISKFRLTSSTKTYTRLYGTRNAAQSVMHELMVGNTSTANRYYTVRYNGTQNTVYNKAAQTNVDLVFLANANSFALYKNNSSLGSVNATSASFTTERTLYVCSCNNNGDAQLTYAFYGRMYYFRMGASRNFVPAKVNNVAGMYETYNDVFYPSASNTEFIAGPEL